MTVPREEKRQAFKVLIRYLQSEIDAMEAEDARGPAAAPPAAPLQPVPFLGRPMKSKHGGACVVCKGGIQPGVDIIYNGASKSAAHARCGQDDGGRR